MAGPIIGWSKKLIDGFRYVLSLCGGSKTMQISREKENQALQQSAHKS
jgi:hypothetical protein